MTLEEQIQKLTAERDGLIALIDKANSVGYGNAVTIQIERIQAERDAARADLKAIGECVGGEPLAVRGLVESMDAAVKERDAALKQVAEMRDALDELVGMACEFIGPDEDGKPECVCCGMSLEAVSKGHKQDCLAQAILDRSHTISSDCGKGYVKAESLRCFQCDDGHTPLYCLNCAREGYVSNQSLIADIEREVLDDEGAMSYAKENGEWDRYSRLEGHKDGLLWVKHHLQAIAHAAKLTSQ